MNIALYLIGIVTFIFNGGHNLLMMVISLELILLSVGLLLVNLSFHLDDLLGSIITLYILPLAGAESAVALALLVSFYPTYVNIGIMLMAAKLIGAGLATIALAGAAVGVGLIFVIFNLVNIKAGMALLFDLV